MLAENLHAVYPVNPMGIAQHLDFCLGNAVKYALHVPYEGCAEDCLKAKICLQWAQRQPTPRVCEAALNRIQQLKSWLNSTNGDELWQDIAYWQSQFLEALYEYLAKPDYGFGKPLLRLMTGYVNELRRVLTLRDMTGQIYEGMTGLPEMP